MTRLKILIVYWYLERLCLRFLVINVIEIDNSSGRSGPNLW